MSLHKEIRSKTKSASTSVRTDGSFSPAFPPNMTVRARCFRKTQSPGSRRHSPRRGKRSRRALGCAPTRLCSTVSATS
jgi:hypothetical protein